MKKRQVHKSGGQVFFIKENSFFARLAAFKLGGNRVAIVLGKTVHLWQATAEDFLKNERWLRHELAHIRQFKEYGFLRFIFLYLAESIRYGYRNNRFEKEARQAETQV